MPRRSNAFQRVVVAVLEKAWANAKGVRIEESAMLTPNYGGGDREVDVVIHDSRVDASRLPSAVEVRDTRRPQDVTWVDSIKGKHDDLSTGALILYSSSGFTADAERKAAHHGIRTVSASDIPASDFFIGGLGHGAVDLIMRVVHFTLEELRVTAVNDVGQPLPLGLTDTSPLYRIDGLPHTRTLKEELAARLHEEASIVGFGFRQVDALKTGRYTADWTDYATSDVQLVVRDGAGVDYKIRRIEAAGSAKTEVFRARLEHKILPEGRVAYGTLKEDGKAAGEIVFYPGDGEEVAATIHLARGGLDAALVIIDQA